MNAEWTFSGVCIVWGVVFGCRLVDGEAMVAGEAFVGKLHFAFAASNGKYKVSAA